MDCETFANKNLPKNRWRRIEQKHKNNIHNICRNPQSNSFCKNVLNSNFVNEKQIKRMSSNNTWYLDPNLVMDLRHESVRSNLLLFFVFFFSLFSISKDTHTQTHKIIFPFIILD